MKTKDIENIILAAECITGIKREEMFSSRKRKSVNGKLVIANLLSEAGLRKIEISKILKCSHAAIDYYFKQYEALKESDKSFRQLKHKIEQEYVILCWSGD